MLEVAGLRYSKLRTWDFTALTNETGIFKIPEMPLSTKGYTSHQFHCIAIPLSAKEGETSTPHGLLA
jgi:hypothetical protein